MKIIIAHKLQVLDAPPELRQAMIGELTLENPRWAENVRMKRWNRGTPRHLRFCHRGREGRLFVPRGYIRRLLILARRYGVPWSIDDRRRSLPPVDFEFKGRLKPFQAKAVEKMLAKEFGTLSAPTGAGKTVMALSMIARRAQPSMVVVHTKDLARQWMSRIGAFLQIPESEIGLIGAGKERIGDRITVALVQSLYSRAEDVHSRVGHLVVDECHRIPSRCFTEAVSEFDARYMMGLSATPWRRDGLSDLIFWHVGALQHKIDPRALVAAGEVLAAEVVFRQTDFKPFSDPVAEYSRMLTELAADDRRNRLIAKDVAAEAAAGKGVCLVLSDRKHHCETLAALLRFGHGVACDLLTGDLKEEERRDVLRRLEDGGVRVLIATGQLIGEGFDSRSLTTLFLATPIRFSGRLLQYLGRVLRPAPGKAKARVFDYVDVHVGPLKAAAEARKKTYGMGKERF
jgi:superfamily II DNA or RNA helicase